MKIFMHHISRLQRQCKVYVHMYTCVHIWTHIICASSAITMPRLKLFSSSSSEDHRWNYRQTTLSARTSLTIS